MWLDELPASMVILGGGYVAAEFAHVFSSLGVEIHIVTEASTSACRPLTQKSRGVSRPKWRTGGMSSSMLPSSGWQSVDGKVVIALHDGTRASGERLLVATGRQPNTEHLDLDVARIALRDDGHISRRPVRACRSRSVGTRRCELALRTQARGQCRSADHCLQPVAPRRSPSTSTRVGSVRRVQRPADRLGRGTFSRSRRTPVRGSNPGIPRHGLRMGRFRIMWACASSTPTPQRAPFSAHTFLATKRHFSSYRWFRQLHMGNESRISPEANIGFIQR